MQAIAAGTLPAVAPLWGQPSAVARMPSMQPSDNGEQALQLDAEKRMPH